MNNKIITIADLGNFNIKYIGADGQGMFSSKISTDYEAYPDGFQRVEMNGRTTYIGTGELSREFNKAARNYIPQLLYAICKGNNADTIETNLTLLLPTIQMENKTKLIAALKDKDFELKFNGKDRIISIKNMLVLPEGYVSYFSLPEEDKMGDLCIIDIGSRTINICIIQDATIQELDTVKLGSFDFYSKIKSIENSKGEDYTEEDIPRLIKNGTIAIMKIQYMDFLNEILNSIKSYVNLKTYHVIWTGGGSLMLQEQIKELELPNSKIHSDPLNSNVIGAEIASRKIWRIEEDAQ